MLLAERAKRVKPSLTLAITAKAKAMAKEGIDVLSFGAGEPDFPTPEHIRRAAAQAMEAGATRYTPSAGLPELRAAIAKEAGDVYGLAAKPENVIVSVGAKHSLFNTILVTCQEGDEVLIPAPYWVSYPDMCAVAGATPVFVEARAQDGYLLRPEDLAKKISAKTRAIFLNSPSNPTGAAYPEQRLRELGEVLKAYPGCYVICDNIYNHIVYDGFAWRGFEQLFPELRDRTIVVNGVSKAYAMTGWRIGWAIAHPELVKAMNNLQDQTTSNPTTIAQHAALAAITGPQGCVGEMVQAFDRRRKLIVDGLNAVPGVRCLMPQGAFYAFCNVEGWYGKRYQDTLIKDDSQLAEILLQKVHVAVIPGSVFGAPGHLRLSYATSEKVIQGGLDKLQAFARSLA